MNHRLENKKGKEKKSEKVANYAKGKHRLYGHANGANDKNSCNFNVCAECASKKETRVLSRMCSSLCDVYAVYDRK